MSQITEQLCSMLKMFFDNNIGDKFTAYKTTLDSPFIDYSKYFGTFIPNFLSPEDGIFIPLISNSDLEVNKLCRINSNKTIITSIRKTPIEHLRNCKINIEGKRDPMFKNELFNMSYINGIHSYLPTPSFKKQFIDNLVVKAYIPKKTPFIIGIDEYTQQISIISSQIILPKIEVLFSKLILGRRIYTVTQDGGKSFEKVCCYEQINKKSI